jgi:hypothetical protein
MKYSSFVLITVFVISNASFAQDFEKSPIVFVHGMMGSGDTWSKTVGHFLDQGYPEDYLEVLNWNSIGGKRSNAGQILDSMVTHLKQRTGHPKVNLVGHSAGGGLSINYILADSVNKNIGNYAHVGSGTIKTKLPVKTLNLYSTDDLIIKGQDSDFVSNQKLEGLDHYEIATDSLSFVAIYQFFNDEAPKAIKNTTQKNINISGKVLAMGENSIPKSAQLEVYAFDAQNGQRRSAKAIYNGSILDTGNWGPIKIAPNTACEFVLTDAAGKRIHYYHPGFTRSNSLVYLRTLPANGMAAMLFAGLPKLDTQSTLVIFSANKATISGRDVLTVNDVTLTTPELTEAKKTIIAHFLFDDKADQTSTGAPIGMYNMVPFLSGADVFLPPKELTTITYNDKKITIKNQPSNEGISVVIFD